ncbi:unnamed protein product [Moneuplotes crassus]|uniref:Uncharacterized protein n=2 Tax=Euplotes crassus TaxID=5936 RepID=A0AAD1Y141_EUPCR|nr:unnamed protein product [Moneuplotes crassus]|eukprot:CAMPEP_0197005328 /NCGR_PEP_ID=MMETSP1380-20130617/28745_1 /TAXON_ID=5936 /ORGANISM="Euplotes crassus, Strain CT5" /LENGTH=150 /DNA_ID=CAMNT_0042424427 /DNA_START=21 /DNA_END=473 /DNA_ORIENTATION=+
MKFILISIVMISLLVVAFGAPFSKVVTANNSKELKKELEGGNDNLYIVNFYMPGDKHEDVKKDLEEKIGGNSRYKDLVNYIEINAARTYQYKDVLTDVGIYNKASNQYPYVLVSKKGDGYLFRGKDIGEGVLGKITNVIEGRVDYSSIRY